MRRIYHLHLCSAAMGFDFGTIQNATNFQFPWISFSRCNNNVPSWCRWSLISQVTTPSSGADKNISVRFKAFFSGPSKIHCIFYRFPSAIRWKQCDTVSHLDRGVDEHSLCFNLPLSNHFCIKRTNLVWAKWFLFNFLGIRANWKNRYCVIKTSKSIKIIYYTVRTFSIGRHWASPPLTNDYQVI